MTNSTIMIGRAYAEAKTLARYYLTLQGVMKVWLFGGVARTGESEYDIDLIIGVEPDTFYSFIDQLNYYYENGWLDDWVDELNPFIIARSEIIERLIKAPLLPSGIQLSGNKILDIFLFPCNWQDSAEKLGGLAFSLQKHFIENIAKDARRYDKDLEDFLPANPLWASARF